MNNTDFEMKAAQAEREQKERDQRLLEHYAGCALQGVMAGNSDWFRIGDYEDDANTIFNIAAAMVARSKL